MDFSYNADEQAFADSARALFADHCTEEALRLHDAGTAPFMEALWRACVETGLHAIVVSEAASGLGQGATALAAVLEEQGRALAGVPLAEHQLACAVVERHGPALAARELSAAAAGVSLWTLSLDALGAAPGLSLRAEREAGGLGGWRLNGCARAVPLAAQSQRAVLPVQVDGGVRLAAVLTEGPGVQRVEGRSQRHLAVADLSFTHAPLPSEALLDPAALAWLEPRWVAAVAAQQLGVCAAQLARTVDYVSQRQQFGRVIGTFQMVQQQLADGQIAVEALRSALAQLLYRIDVGLGCLPQALSVKVLAAQAGHAVGHKAQHVHGGMGVDISYPIHRYLYWNRALGLTLGGAAPTLDRLGDWLASHDALGWKYDLPEDRPTDPGDRHAI